MQNLSITIADTNPAITVPGVREKLSWVNRYSLLLQQKKNYNINQLLILPTIFVICTEWEKLEIFQAIQSGK